MRKLNYYLKVACLILAAIFAANTTICLAADEASATTDNFAVHDKKYQDFSYLFYQTYVKNTSVAGYTAIQKLIPAINDEISNNNIVNAIGLIYRNIELIKSNIDKRIALYIIPFLLQQNETGIANLLFEQAKTVADRAVITAYTFDYAEYYFARNNWPKTIELIQSLPGDLAKKDYHKANLMHGIALQHTNQHRKAIVQYKKIPKTSEFYTSAQLDMAIANIRQDWWTDAYEIINKLLKNPAIKENDEHVNRLYTILGYLFLHQHFYRNSRDTFRNVNIDSMYSNKALLGIALSAAYQSDFIGALNAVNILKNKKTTDLPVAEANLLVPYFYEKLKQQTTAAAGYNEAITYFQSRINDIDTAVAAIPTLKSALLNSPDKSHLVINKEIIPTTDVVTAAFVAESELLQIYGSHVDVMNNAKLTEKYISVKNDFSSYWKQSILKYLKNKSSQLSSYMSQCRYGLARLYDSSKKMKK